MSPSTRRREVARCYHGRDDTGRPPVRRARDGADDQGLEPAVPAAVRGARRPHHDERDDRRAAAEAEAQGRVRADSAGARRAVLRRAAGRHQSRGDGRGRRRWSNRAAPISSTSTSAARSTTSRARAWAPSIGRQPKRIRRIVDAMKRGGAARAGHREDPPGLERRRPELPRAGAGRGRRRRRRASPCTAARATRATGWPPTGTRSRRWRPPCRCRSSAMATCSSPTRSSARERGRGAPRVMSARGVLIKPWLFREVSEGYLDLDGEARVAIYRRYVALALEHWGGRRATAAQRVREFLRWHVGFWCRYAPPARRRLVARRCSSARADPRAAIAARGAAGAQRDPALDYVTDCLLNERALDVAAAPAAGSGAGRGRAGGGGLTRCGEPRVLALAIAGVGASRGRAGARSAPDRRSPRARCASRATGIEVATAGAWSHRRCVGRHQFESARSRAPRPSTCAARAHGVGRRDRARAPPGARHGDAGAPGGARSRRRSSPGCGRRGATTGCSARRDARWLLVGDRRHERLSVLSRTVCLDEASLAQAMRAGAIAGLRRRTGWRGPVRHRRGARTAGRGARAGASGARLAALELVEGARPVLLSSRDSPRSASRRPPVWHVGQ